jgi:PKD repeat protein
MDVQAHTYTTAGTYEFKLTMIDDDGGSSELTVATVVV